MRLDNVVFDDVVCCVDGVVVWMMLCRGCCVDGVVLMMLFLMRLLGRDGS